MAYPRNLVITLLMAFIIPNGWTRTCAADKTIPDMTLNRIVELYVGQQSAIERIQAKYSTTMKDLGTQIKLNGTSGLFGINGRTLAVRNDQQHVVFDGEEWKYTYGSYFGSRTSKPAAAFAAWWSNPALLFGRMQDTEYTPICDILRDAIGRKAFGSAKLMRQPIKMGGRECYVVQGVYDRTKLRGLKNRAAIPWKYRLCLDPSCGMQVVHMETTNVVQNIPLGVLDCQEIERHSGLWIPTKATLVTFAYSKNGKQMTSVPAVETSIFLDSSSLIVNGKLDESLFNVKWAEAQIVRDEIAGKH